MKILRCSPILLAVLVLSGCNEWDKIFGAASKVEVVTNGPKFSIRNNSKSERVKVTFFCYNKDREFLAEEVIDSSASIYPLVADYQYSGSAADVEDKSGFRAAQNRLFKARQEYQKSFSTLNEQERQVFEQASSELKRANDLAIKNLQSRIAESQRRLSNAENETRELSLVYDNVQNPYGVDISGDIVRQARRSNSRANNAASTIRSMRNEIEHLRSQAIDPADYIDPLSPERVKTEANLNAALLGMEKYEDDFCDLVEVQHVAYVPSEKEPSARTADEPELYEVQVNATELARAYSQNTVAADSKYKDKKIRVTGVVSEINTDILNNAVVIMEGGEIFSFNNPQFILRDDQKKSAIEISIGQSISLVCVGSGDIAKTPVSEECMFD